MIRLPESGRWIGGELIPWPSEIACQRDYTGKRTGPWKRSIAKPKMTLCIAATCERGHYPNHGPCAILSYDRKVSEVGAGSHQIGHKMEMVGKRWWTLISSDDIDQARDMLRFFRSGISSQEATITIDTALDVLYGCLHDYQTEVLNRFVHNECGLSLKEFLTLPEGANLDAEQRKRISEAIASGVPGHQPHHEVLFVGWIPHQKRGLFHIFCLAGNDIVRKLDFAAIGSGCFIAHTMWNIRQKTPFRFLPDTLYRVYEAQRMGAAEPSVGSEAYIQVLTMEKDEIVIRALQSRGDDEDDYPSQLWKRYLGLNDLERDGIKEESFSFFEYHDRA